MSVIHRIMHEWEDVWREKVRIYLFNGIKATFTEKWVKKRLVCWEMDFFFLKIVLFFFILVVAVSLSSNNKILQFRAEHSFLNLETHQLHLVFCKWCCFGIYFWAIAHFYLPYRSSFIEVCSLCFSCRKQKICRSLCATAMLFFLSQSQGRNGEFLCGWLREKLS